MRTKWPALLLVVTLGTGLLTIGKTNEARRMLMSNRYRTQT